jgi:hypothetical protein
MSSARVTGAAVLALGFAASASAVVPGFAQLLHGSKTYLARPRPGSRQGRPAPGPRPGTGHDRPAHTDNPVNAFCGAAGMIWPRR